LNVDGFLIFAFKIFLLTEQLNKLIATYGMSSKYKLLGCDWKEEYDVAYRFDFRFYYSEWSNKTAFK